MADLDPCENAMSMHVDASYRISSHYTTQFENMFVDILYR